MIPPLPLSKIREMQSLVGPESVNLGLGQPVIEPPQELIAIVEETLRSADLGYTAFAGIPELREQIASRVIGSEGKREQVCITVGTTEALFASMLTLLGPGDEVLIPDPGFISYQAVSRIVGATPVRYPVRARDGFRVDVDTIAACITENTKALIINSPNNPTGRIIPGDDLKRLGKLADEHDFYIFSEEVYSSINFTGTTASAWGISDRVFLIDGISKIYAMTGWRLGWVVGPKALIKPITTTHHYMVACAPAIAQQVLLRLNADNGTPGKRIRNVIQHAYNRRRHAMIEAITHQLGWEYIPPDGAFYLMLKIPGKLLKGSTSEKIAKQMVAEQDVVTIPGSAFGTEGEGYLRLSFAVTEETIYKGIERIAKFAGTSNAHG